MDCLIPAWLYRMTNTPVTTPLQLHLKPPTLNWDGNLHENFKSFKIRATVLLEGPYSRYDPADKVAALLSWMAIKDSIYTTQLNGVPITRGHGKIFSKLSKDTSNHVKLSCRVGTSLVPYIAQIVRTKLSL